jgi:hypothetical protein
MPTIAVASSPFQYIQEWDDEFLALFPHRYDYIWAEHPKPTGKVEWKTESRHPLSDRLIHQGAFLYGVRFGAETQYCLFDIDIDSIYHPQRDPFAISRICAALEPLGLVSAIACTSSYSGGIHLYFPFEHPQKTWELSLALQAVLENAGFKPALGQLELFPNARLFVTEGMPSLYAAHRLPMQAGSYILTNDWQLTNSNQTTFVQHWRFAQRRNDIHAKTLQQVLKTARRKRYSLSGKADKFLNDLNAEIESGWNSVGQTNHILGRIAMRSYIFGHLLYDCEPLTGKALINDIGRVARSLPGYAEWCRHQNEIEHRAEEWAQCVEASDYFPFGHAKEPPAAINTAPQQETTLTWNQQRSQAARDRIRQAIADLLNNGTLPANATARFQALTHYGIGGGSLYRHRDLWHPAHLRENPTVDSAIEGAEHLDNASPANSSNPKIRASSMDSAEGAPIEEAPRSLLSKNDGNTFINQGSRGFLPENPTSIVGNQLQNGELGDRVGIPDIAIASAIAKQPWLSAQQHKQERARTVYIQRMRQYWESDDPILMTEAEQWARANPGILDMPIAVDDQSQQKVTSVLADPLTGNALLRQTENSVRLTVDSEIFGQETAVPTDEESLEVADHSDILAQISVHRQRLGWTPTQAQEALSQRFGKASQALLTDSELMEWLIWLQGKYCFL